MGPCCISSSPVQTTCVGQLNTFSTRAWSWVPHLWKTSCVQPMLKSPHPKDLNSCRWPMTVCLSIWHWGGWRCHLLHPSLSYLQKAGSTVRVTCFHFSLRHLTAHISEGQVGVHRGGPPPHGIDLGLPHQPTTVLRTQDCDSDMVVCSRDSPGSLPHPLHCELSAQIS